MLPYGVKCADFKYDNNGNKIDTVEVLGIVNPYSQTYSYVAGLIHEISRIKPYLRPMSSMTEEERNEYFDFRNQELQRVAFAEIGRESAIAEISDWFNVHHFDYRGLIEKGLALEAPEDMYK